MATKIVQKSGVGGATYVQQKVASGATKVTQNSSAAGWTYVQGKTAGGATYVEGK